MTVYVLSTMTGSVGYSFYKKVGNLPVLQDKVMIKGGTGLPTMRSGFGEVVQDGEGAPIWTADGMVTPLSDSRYALLKDHWLFKKHLEGGFLKVINHDITGNHKEVKKHVQTMIRRDGFAQLTPASLKEKLKVRTTLSSETELRI